MKKIIILINIILGIFVFIILLCCNNDHKMTDKIAKDSTEIEQKLIKKDTIIINWIKSYFYYKKKIDCKSDIPGFYIEVIFNNYTSRKIKLNVRENEDEILKSNFYLLYYNEIKKTNDTIFIKFMDRGMIHEISPYTSDTLLLKTVMHSLNDEELCLSTFKICKEGRLMLKSNLLYDFNSKSQATFEILKGDEFKIEIRFSRPLPKPS